MRVITKPSTAACNLEIYSLYLLGEPNYTSCLKLSEAIENISHDSVNRFLNREDYTPQDLFNDSKLNIDLADGSLSIDDSVLDKFYSNPKYTAFVDYFWSGKHKRIVKGINLITLFYTDKNGVCMPVSYRIYDKSLEKTKNDYFREMLEEVIKWGLNPSIVTGDAWYSSLENLKFVRKHGLSFMFGIDSNRIISIQKGSYIQVQELQDWQLDGTVVYLKDFGNVKVFRQEYKGMYRYYIMGVPKLDMLELLMDNNFKDAHATHWTIECFHRAIKQACNIERFHVRNKTAIKNHIFCALYAFIKLEAMRVQKLIVNWYQIKRQLFRKVIKEFIIQEYSKELTNA
jgi:hypothetical protein